MGGVLLEFQTAYRRILIVFVTTDIRLLFKDAVVFSTSSARGVEIKGGTTP
jgi:hypothetical protein